MKHESIWRAVVTAMAVTLAVCLSSAPAFTAESKPEPEATATPPEALPSPIPLASIPAERVSTHKFLRDQEAWARSDTTVSGIEALFVAEKTRLSQLFATSDPAGFAEVSTADLKESKIRWNSAVDQLDGWLADLGKTATTLERDLKHLRSEQQVWGLSLDYAIETDAPPVVVQTIQSTLERVNRSELSMENRRDETLVLQTKISDSRMALTEGLDQVVDEMALRHQGDLTGDQIPLWQSIMDPQVDQSLFSQILDKTKRNWRESRTYIREQPQRIAAQALLGLAFLFLVRFLGKRAIDKNGDDPEAQAVLSTMTIRPLATAILLSMVLAAPLYPQAPDSWLRYLSIFLVLALVRLLPRLLQPELRALPYLVFGLFILHRISNLVPIGNVLNHLLQLSLTLAATATMYWGLKTIGRMKKATPSPWLLLLQFGTGIAAILGCISVFLNVFGDTRPAYHLTEGILTSAFAAILLWTVIQFLRTLTVVILQSDRANKLLMVAGDRHTICNVCVKLFRWAAIITWGYFTLKGFGKLEPTQSTVNRMLHQEIEFGSITLTPANLLHFSFAIWLSFLVSRLLRFIIEKEVFSRTSLPRGVPETISKAIHYGTLIIGFFIALSAIGIDSSSLALVLGALGFGISFGLQNVVNNFVSGLILLFERPVRVGDKIQVGEMGGVVGEIGIRATTVHTWDGADVIVPNANLISNEIINWTFSDHKRRIEVKVGVAYGVDPETVLALLPSLAAKHPDVLAEPEPIALFLGFGDSSLDFSLRCWTKAPAPDIQSDIGVAVNRALVEAGIEVPFPQQDLHVRSVDEKIREEFGSKG